MAGEGDARSSADLAVKYDSWSKVGEATRPLRPQVRPCGQSNLANNLFASSCDNRRPIIDFDTCLSGLSNIKGSLGGEASGRPLLVALLKGHQREQQPQALRKADQDKPDSYCLDRQ